jgi:hypothetical protein
MDLRDCGPFLVRIIGFFVLVLVSYAIYRVVYNIFFHPLRDWPGPRWAAATDFFKLWILHTKQAHTLGIKYHARYGPVVRAAPNLLAVDDPRLLPLIYHRRANKTDVYTTGVLGDLAPPFQTIDWKDHARKRKRVASSFLLSNLVKLEGQVDARIMEWTGALASRFADASKSMDFAAWSQWFAYDTICQLSFGEPLGFVREARDVFNLIKNFHDMAPFAAVVGALPWLCAPVLQSPITKWLFMPRQGDSSGTGKIMAVSPLNRPSNLDDSCLPPCQCLPCLANASHSSETLYWKTGCVTQTVIMMGASWTIL